MRERSGAEMRDREQVQMRETESAEMREINVERSAYSKREHLTSCVSYFKIPHVNFLAKE